MEQSKALRLMFTLINGDVLMAHEFIESDGYEMIAKVFVTSRCVMGYEILKVRIIIVLLAGSALFSYRQCTAHYVASSKMAHSHFASSILIFSSLLKKVCHGILHLV